jgi:transcription initiation factor TFIID subunit TAF12
MHSDTDQHIVTMRCTYHTMFCVLTGVHRLPRLSEGGESSSTTTTALCDTDLEHDVSVSNSTDDVTQQQHHAQRHQQQHQQHQQQQYPQQQHYQRQARLSPHLEAAGSSESSSSNRFSNDGYDGASTETLVEGLQPLRSNSTASDTAAS